MLTGLANPARFMAVSRPLVPVLAAAAVLLLAVGTWLSFTAPPDYQQGNSVRMMFVHVPAAYMGLFAYACMGGPASPAWSGAMRWPTPQPRPPPRWVPASPSWPW